MCCKTGLLFQFMPWKPRLLVGLYHMSWVWTTPAEGSWEVYFSLKALRSHVVVVMTQAWIDSWPMYCEGCRGRARKTWVPSESAHTEEITCLWFFPCWGCRAKRQLSQLQSANGFCPNQGRDSFTGNTKLRSQH